MNPDILKKLQSEEWVTTMNEELCALEENNTWEITHLPPGKQAISCTK